MKILSIGNSFTQDAQRFLHDIAKANGKNLKCVNLYIGGCNLRSHYLNMLDDEKKYIFEFNGVSTGIYVSIKEALKSDTWDYITLHQASYVNRVGRYIRDNQVSSKATGDTGVEVEVIAEAPAK